MVTTEFDWPSWGGGGGPGMPGAFAWGVFPSKQEFVFGLVTNAIGAALFIWGPNTKVKVLGSALALVPDPVWWYLYRASPAEETLDVLFDFGDGSQWVSTMWTGPGVVYHI